jgi:predicted Zn-dependent protease
MAGRRSWRQAALLTLAIMAAAASGAASRAAVATAPAAGGATGAAAAAPAADPAGEPLAGAVTESLVIARAAVSYEARLALLDGANALDADQRFTDRVRRIAGPLIAQAARDYPATAAWSWQIHTSADPAQDADCMAGGKILVSQDYADRLALGDAELAMLLAHEIAHAALGHNLQEYQLALRLEPARAALPFADLWQAVDTDPALMARLAPLGRAQENEADRAGLQLAVRAGWPAARLANYYRKLLRASAWPALDSDTHPSPLSRWRAAQAQAAGLPH